MNWNDAPFDALLSGAKDGSDTARAELLRRFAPALLARVRSRLAPALRRRLDSDDIVLSVQADLLAQLDTFEDRGARAFRSWLLTTAQNKISSKYRRLLDQNGGQREAPDEERVAAARSPRRGPATDAEESDKHAAAERLRIALGPSDRTLLDLRLRAGLSFAEIARQVGAPSANAARMRFRRVVEQMRQQADPDG